jgi:hypothetical protein
MYVINSSGETLIFKYNKEEITLAPNETLPVALFDSQKLSELRDLIKNNFLTFYDDEEPEEFNYNFPMREERKIIKSKKGFFNNIHLEDE